jgi:hypothetical protein
LRSNEHLLVRLARFLSPHLTSTALNALSVVGFTFDGVLISINPVKTSNPLSWIYTTNVGIIFSISTLILLLSVILSWREDKHVLQLERKIKFFEENEISTKDISEKIFEIELLALWKNISYTNTERISIYSYSNNYVMGGENNDVEGFFTFLGCYSSNPTYKIPEKVKIYRLGRGCLGLACQDGTYLIENLPDPIQEREDYFNQVVSSLKIDLEDARSQRMHSRSYAGFAITSSTNGSRLGVIVFESTKPQGINKDNLFALMNTDRELYRLELILQPSFLPRPAQATNEGF